MYKCCLLRALTIILIYILSTLPHNTAVTHERNLIWAQKDEVTGVARLVGVTGDPNFWVQNRTATTKYITSPKNSWKFKALGFNFQRKTLYWSDTGNKKIQGLQLNGSHAAFSVFEGTSSQVEGLTVDWITGNMYWTDALYNWIILVPGRKESNLYSVIVNTDLDRPAGIAVAPHQGLLFWADWGILPKIERSTCSGEGRRVLVSDDVMKPVGMTLDNSHDVIYWTDAMKGTIETVDIYGNNRKTLFLVDGARFFGITQYQNYIFVTEQEERQLYVFDLVKSRHEVKFSTGSRPYDVMMYDDDIQPTFTDPCTSAECSHICVPAGRTRSQCVCGTGYKLQPDGKSCKDDGHFGSPQFLYSIGTALCRFPGNMADMSLTNISLDTQCFLTHRRDALAIAAHVHKDAVFISENKTRTISVIKLAEGEAPEVIVGGTGSVEGLAVDWVASNIYWTDAIFKQIMVARTDGRFQMQLVSSQLERPRGIAVDPINGHLYWTDVGSKPRIELSLLDGSKRSTLVSTNLGSPNHLALDFRSQLLCWSDSGMDRLECMGLNRKRRKVVVSQTATDMYGVALFQDYIIWTDQNTRNGIHAAIRDTGQKVRGIIHPGIGTAYDVITYDSSQQPLVHGPCGEGNGGCEQLCLATPRGQSLSYVCQCAMGFVLGSDKRSCIADAYYDNFLLFTDTYQKQIYQMSLASQDFHAIPLGGHDNPIAVDYDPLYRKVYWSDVAEKVIKCAFLNGTGESIVKQLDQDSVPDGLALEPSSRLAYYTDTGLKVIGAVTLDSGHHHVIINKLLDQPRAVVLDPGRGHMYWSDWGLHSRIEKANMDGSARRRIINTGLGAWPNGLAIDPKGARLYWCDARSDRIETSDLDGHDRKVIFRDAESHFFGMATLAGAVFYTDWTKKSIMRIDTRVEPVKTKPVGPTLFARLNDVHVYKSNYLEKRYTDNACGYRNGGCSHLCLPIPSGRTCACPEGRILVSGYRCVISNDMETKPTPTTTVDSILSLVSSTTTTTSTPPPPRRQHPSYTPRPRQKPGRRNKPQTRPTPSTTTPTTTTTRQTTTTATTTTTTTTTPKPTTKSTTTTTTTTTTTPAPTTNIFYPPTNYYPHDRHFPGRNSPKIPHDSDGLIVDTFTRKPTTPKPRTYPGNQNTVKPKDPHKNRDRGEKGRNKVASGEEGSEEGEGENRNREGDDRIESNTTSDPTPDTSNRLDDFEFSMFALLAIIIGGIVLMCLIVASAVVLYKKMDPGRPRRRRMEPALSTLSDMYEMPDKERRQGQPSEMYPEGPGSRYGYMHDRYYNGDLDSASPGTDNMGFARPDSMNTYEEILEDSNESRSHISFSTFR